MTDPATTCAIETLRRSWRVGELLDAPAVTRLRGIGFLGVLGPGPKADPRDSRFAHSVMVANLVAGVAQRLGLDGDAARCGIAAGLLHDAGNRAMSHTLEAAFDAVSGTRGRDLTRDIVLSVSPRRVPRPYGVRSILLRIGIDPTRVWNLLDKAQRQPREPADRVMFTWFRSALSPDTLDGIARAAGLLGQPCPAPSAVASTIELGALAMPGIRHESLEVTDSFWSAKQRVYDERINSPSAVTLERAWAGAGACVLSRRPAARLFELRDEAVRDQIRSAVGHSERGVPNSRQAELFDERFPLRFRPPSRYWVAEGALRDRAWIELGATRLRYRTRVATPWVDTDDVDA